MSIHKFELWQSLKGTESMGDFFSFSTYFCLCSKHIHTESFVDDKLSAIFPIQHREMVNACSISCLHQRNEQCYGAVHRYNDSWAHHVGALQRYYVSK